MNIFFLFTLYNTIDINRLLKLKTIKQVLRLKTVKTGRKYIKNFPMLFLFPMPTVHFLLIKTIAAWSVIYELWERNSVLLIKSALCLSQRLARTGIIVTTSESILLQLVADKEHPKFKEIQNLIKASAPESGLLSKVWWDCAQMRSALIMCRSCKVTPYIWTLSKL